MRHVRTQIDRPAGVRVVVLRHRGPLLPAVSDYGRPLAAIVGRPADNGALRTDRRRARVDPPAPSARPARPPPAAGGCARSAARRGGPGRRWCKTWARTQMVQDVAADRWA